MSNLDELHNLHNLLRELDSRPASQSPDILRLKQARLVADETVDPEADREYWAWMVLYLYAGNPA